MLFAATPLTKLKLTAASTAGELILPGASGVLYRDFGVELDHDFRRWLTGAVKLGFGADTYFGVSRFDNRYSAGLSLAYKLTRTVAIRENSATTGSARRRVASITMRILRFSPSASSAEWRKQERHIGGVLPRVNRAAS